MQAAAACFQIDNICPHTNWSANQTTPVCASCSSIAPEYQINPVINPTTGAPVTVFPTGTWPNPLGVAQCGLLFDKMFAGILPFANSYSVKFTEVGSYPYMCPIHLDIGMIAEVVVKPLGQPLCTNVDVPETCAAVLTTPVSVLGDPQFVGLLGQSYQVHGIDGAVYSLISEPSAQVNARFSFLTGPRPCPTVQVSWSKDERARPISCWSHSGSYLSELALFTPTARLFIQAGSAATGFAAIDFNRTTDSSSDMWYDQLSSHHLTVTLGSFILHIDNSDGFVNIAQVQPRIPLSRLTAHGLLGQTHARPVSGRKVGASQHIEGEVDEYVVQGGLWGVDDVYNRYGVQSE